MCSSDSNRYSKLIAACTLTLVILGFQGLTLIRTLFKIKRREREKLVIRWIDLSIIRRGKKSSNSSFVYLKCEAYLVEC